MKITWIERTDVKYFNGNTKVYLKKDIKVRCLVKTKIYTTKTNATNLQNLPFHDILYPHDEFSLLTAIYFSLLANKENFISLFPPLIRIRNCLNFEIVFHFP
jgi:hypothetical protein